MTHYRAPGHYLEVAPGIDIYYEDHGSGDPIVFIPGWTFTTELFDHQIAHFSKTHRVIVMDPRSHGRSTITVHGNDYTTQGADLARLLTHLDLQNVTLVGWSFGCLAQWAYVRAHGADRLKAMVFVDLSPRPLSTQEGDWVEGPLGDIAGAYTTFLTSRQGQRDFVTGYATDVMVQRELAPAELAWIVGESLNTPYYIAAAYFAAGMFSDYLEEAQKIDETLPALSICAEHWAETATAFMNKHCPNTKTAVLGGHMMFWEHSDKFNAIVDEFLAGVK